MRVLWFTALVIIVDQATKLLVMKTMYLGQQIPLLGDWLKLTYTENPGMAFGITFGPRAMVTVFSVIATFLIILYLFKVRKGYFPYRASLAFILGGALGNIIDRVFYGAFFNADSYFVGKVVDFIHVNVWSGFIPESIPLLGGTYLSLFPIWNVADMAIVCGVVGILYFQKRYHFAEYYGSDAVQVDDDGEESTENARLPLTENASPSPAFAPPESASDSVRAGSNDLDEGGRGYDPKLDSTGNRTKLGGRRVNNSAEGSDVESTSSETASGPSSTRTDAERD